MFNTSDTAKGFVRPAQGGWRVLALAAGVLASGVAGAARLGLNPVMGDGAAGRTVMVSGSGFLPGATLNVTFNGVATLPAAVTASATGFIAPVSLTLPALPFGGRTVVLANASRTYTFTDAYRVFANLCLEPAMGDGRAGRTWETDAAIPVGGWSGMVFRIEGTGFSAGVTIAADSITVGGAATDHPPVLISASGGLPSTTVIVTANLSRGSKDLLIPAGASTTVFAGAYEVRRSLGLFPASGPNAGGATATTFMEGFGFDDTPVAANSITIGAAATQHAAFTPVNGAWSGVVRLLGAPGNNGQNVVTAQETFISAWLSVKGTDRKLGVTPVTLSGVPNQAIQVQGMGHWTSGQSIAANTSLLLGPGQDQTMTHGAVGIVAGRFARTWMKIDGSQSDPANGIRIMDPVAGKIDTKCVDLKPSFFLCPVRSTGAPGWTVTITGFGMARNRVMLSLTTGGGLAQIAGAPVSDTFGETPPFAAFLSAIPAGSWSGTLFDGVRAYVLPRTASVVPTIGLSAVNGPGGAGETFDLLGTGFASGAVIGANAIALAGPASTGTTHPAITVSFSGSFTGTTVTVPTALPAGAYDLTAAGVFPAAYRVTPMIAVAKHASPPSGGRGDTVTFALSFTNIGVGDAAGGPFTLVDTIPAGLVYVPASAASAVPLATIDWRSWSCSCWVPAEPPAADVAAVRWALPGALPNGASGLVWFQGVAP